MNEEILLLREELFTAYKPMLLNIFDEKTVNMALHHFLAMPNNLRKLRTSLEVLCECCRIAHTSIDKS